MRIKTTAKDTDTKLLNNVFTVICHMEGSGKWPHDRSNLLLKTALDMYTQ